MKLNDNIYVINLLVDFDVISTFNIDCLVDYKGLDVISFVDELSPEPFREPLLFTTTSVFPYAACQIDKFLNDKIITTQLGVIQKYLI